MTQRFSKKLQFFDQTIGTAQKSIYSPINIFIHLSIYLSIYQSIYLSVYLPACLSINLFNHLSIYQSIHPPICLSIYIYEPIHPSINIFIHLSSTIISHLSSTIIHLSSTYSSARLHTCTVTARRRSSSYIRTDSNPHCQTSERTECCSVTDRDRNWHIHLDS